MSTALAAKPIVVQWIYTFCLRCIQLADYVRNALPGRPRKTDPKGCKLNDEEQSVEVIAAGVLTEFVSRGDDNAMALARAPGSWTGCNKGAYDCCRS